MSNLVSWLLLFLAPLLLVSGDLNEFHGPCPVVQPASDFNLSEFVSDKWYLVESTDDDGDRCVVLEMTESPQKTSHLTGRERDNDVINKLRTYTMDTPGIFTFTERDGDRDDYVVLEVDYDSLAVVYTCDFDRKDNEHEEEVYFYVRKDKLAEKATLVATAKSGLAARGVMANAFFTVDQSSC